MAVVTRSSSSTSEAHEDGVPPVLWVVELALGDGLVNGTEV
jgi:hypothetical protein